MVLWQELKAAVKDILNTQISTLEEEKLGASGVNLEEPYLLKKLDPTPEKGRTILYAEQDSAEGKAGKCELLRTYDCKNAARPPARHDKIWEACRATSAALVYFKHIELERKSYFDGGLTSNNPIRELYQEAPLECPGQMFEAIVSIGAGKPPYKCPPKTLFAFMKRAMDQMTDTETKHINFLEDMENVPIDERASVGGLGETLADRYFRLYDAGSLYKVEKAANDFMSSADGSSLIWDCARRLAYRRPIRA